MDPIIQTLIQSVVDQFVQEDRLFTAYDVTKEARTKTRTNIRHPEAKQEVHRLMEPYVNRGLFKKAPINIPGVHEAPFLYFPDRADPSTYRPGGTQATGRFAQLGSLQPPPALPAASSDDDDDDELKGQEPDGRGRICVPAHLVRDLGLRSGMTAFVHVGNNEIMVYKDQPQQFIASYVVDKDDNIRLSRQIAANITSRPVNFVIDGQAIRVS